MDDNVEGTSGMDRRSMLRKAAMGSAFVWATPVVQTLGTRVAAAATKNFVACPEEGGGSPPKQLGLRWTGEACSGSDGDALVSVSGDQGAIAGSVDIVVTYGPGGPNTKTATFTDLAPGDTFILGSGQPDEQLNPEATFEIYAAGTIGTADPIRTVVVHTSCSQPLLIGDTYCGIKLEGGF